MAKLPTADWIVLTSRDMAFPMLPSIFSFPVMKAVVGFSLPANILPKSAVLRVNLEQTSACA